VVMGTVSVVSVRSLCDVHTVSMLTCVVSMLRTRRTWWFLLCSATCASPAATIGSPLLCCRLPNSTPTLTVHTTGLLLLLLLGCLQFYWWFVGSGVCRRCMESDGGWRKDEAGGWFFRGWDQCCEIRSVLDTVCWVKGTPSKNPDPLVSQKTPSLKSTSLEQRWLSGG